MLIICQVNAMVSSFLLTPATLMKIHKVQFAWKESEDGPSTEAQELRTPVENNQASQQTVLFDVMMIIFIQMKRNVNKPSSELINP